MIVLATFAAGVLSILAMPGPTNTLLAAGGAQLGFRRAWPLVMAEAAGYLTSVGLIMVSLGPVLRSHPGFAQVLRAACIAYLLWLAIMLWRRSAAEPGPIVGIRSLYAATVLNPKGLIFGLVLMPPQAAAVPSVLVSCLGVLVLLVGVAGTGWVAAGSALQKGLPDSVVQRCGATALMIFAVVIGASFLAA